MLQDLGLKQPSNRTARNLPDAISLAQEIGYPIVVRPSYVLGGRAMEIVYDETDLKEYMSRAVAVSNDSPVLLDRFLDKAIEVDVECDLRWPGRDNRRHHGAHRTGGYSLR